MDKWYSLYWKIVDDNQFGFVGKVFNRVVRRFVKRHMDNILPESFIQKPVDWGLNQSEKRERPLICSMTSFPARINDVWVSIETLFRQTKKADSIILWLSKEQFRGVELPDSIKRCQSKGLKIRWVDEDLRSHKKYFYVLQEAIDSDIVLVDDDIYYPEQLLENLLDMSKRHPGSICATRVHKMKYEGETLMPYSKWIHNYNPSVESASDSFFFTSGAGTLIPTSILPSETFNDEVFKRICFFADDVWLNMMARKAGAKVFTNDKFDKDEISVCNSQKVKLVNTNVGAGGNDRQIQLVMEYIRNNE